MTPDMSVTAPRQSIWQQRWRRFRQHRLAFWSLIGASLLIILSLAAPLLANDRPLLVRYQSQWYVPVLRDYPETTFGGVFETATEYRDPAVQQLIHRQDGLIVWPLIRFADQTTNLDLQVPVPSPPSAQNWLGTDEQGRDILARLLYGLRISILFGAALTLAGSLIGIAVGALQGYDGGWTDLLGQRFIEVWGGLPVLFLIIILSSFFTPTVYWLFLVMLLFGWMGLVGLVRAEFLRARNLDYVRAARSLGATDRTIMFRHILPNALASSLSQLPFILTANITALTALDYLGYGLPPGSPSLGEMMKQAGNNLDAPWIAFSGFVALSLLLSMLVLIGEGVRDAFDPRR